MAAVLTFISGSKVEQYLSLLPQVRSLIEGEVDLVANLAYVAAALKEAFDFFWVGFYLVKQDQLVLGPFQGPVACTRIRKGKGVCGTAWQEGATLLVPDVEVFPGHIACSSLSRSEIVVPLIKDGEVWGVLDIDSDLLNFFDETDRKYLEELSLPPQNKSIVGGTHQKDSIIVSVIDAVRNVPGKHYNVYSCALRERCDDSSLSSLQRYPLAYCFQHYCYCTFCRIPFFGSRCAL